MPNLESLKITVEIIGSLTGAIFFCYKIFIKKWYRNYKEREQAKWDNLHAVLNKQDAVNKQIKDKLFPNGGSSIDDKVEKIIVGVSALQMGQRNTLDILDIASWESDSEGRFVYVSTSLCELMGATPGELLGNSWVGDVAHFDRDAVLKAWHESIRYASGFNIKFSIKKSDGNYQDVSPVVIHNKDKQGKVISSLGRLVKVGELYKRT